MNYWLIIVELSAEGSERAPSRENMSDGGALMSSGVAIEGIQASRVQPTGQEIEEDEDKTDAWGGTTYVGNQDAFESGQAG